MPNGTPRTPWQPHRQYVNERTERQQTVMQILKAARVAASDIVGVSAATSGRLSTSRLLRSESHSSRIIGWVTSFISALRHWGGIGVFILAALDSSVLPTLGGVDAFTILLA